MRDGGQVSAIRDLVGDRCGAAAFLGRRHRPLHPNPSSKRDLFGTTRQGCDADLSDVAQSLCETYDWIEISKIEPDV